MQLEFQEYITSRVDIDENGCWLWVLTRDPDGYGEGCFQKRKRRAHRLAWEAFKGPIPPGFHVDHLCRVRHCVNPEHLEPVTAGENIRRGLTGYTRRTECKRGHKFAEHGRLDSQGRNQCRECDRLRNRQFYERNRETVLAKMRAKYNEDRRAA